MLQNKWLINGLGVIGLILAFWAGSTVMKWYRDSTPAAEQARAMQNTYRPGFVLPDLEGRLRDVNEWNGRVLVVNFWATWCPPCRKEMPAFMDLQERYGKQGLQFVGIALDELDKVQDYVDTLGVEYPILVGGDKAMQVAIAYGNSFGALPYTAIIDRQGTIVAVYRGELEGEEAESVIKPLL